MPTITPTAPTRRIDEIIVGTRHRREVGNLDSLTGSIAELGLLHPVVVTPDNRLVAGERRLRACQALGWDAIPVRVLDVQSIVRAEAAENFERQDFTPSEAVAIKRTLEPELKAAAELRMKTGQPSENFSKGRAADKASAFTGYSRFTLDKAEAIVEAAEAEPERFGKLAEDMDRTGRVNGVYRRLSNMQQAERIRAEPPPLPRGPFRVITADPPWPYEEARNDPSTRGVHPYPTMHIDEIRSLPVASLAAEDCVLWLWVPSLLLANGTAAKVLEAWQFAPRTILTWAKHKMGNGTWLRGQTEHAVMAVRGHPTVTLTNQTTLLHACVTEHSAKPDEFYALVESLCPAPRYLELFARKARPGWDVWGDEVPSDVAAPAPPPRAERARVRAKAEEAELLREMRRTLR